MVITVLLPKINAYAESVVEGVIYQTQMFDRRRFSLFLYLFSFFFIFFFVCARVFLIESMLNYILTRSNCCLGIFSSAKGLAEQMAFVSLLHQKQVKF